MVCINLSNLICHAVYSVLAAFFPQEAKAKGMGDDAVGIIFASFAAVIFLCSPLAGRFMSYYGKVWVYITGLVIVSVSTICFSVASLLPAGLPFASWCLCMRLLQGVGSAMEEVCAHHSTIRMVTPRNIFRFDLHPPPCTDGCVCHHR